MGQPIDEIRETFGRVEAEADPDLKFEYLEEALDLTDDFLQDNPESKDATVVHNLRRSYLRRLLGQLVQMRKVEIDSWLNYTKLFTFRVGSDIDEIVKDYYSLAVAYDEFIDLWRNEIIALIERRKAKI
jgi:hypothetical protein